MLRLSVSARPVGGGRLVTEILFWRQCSQEVKCQNTFLKIEAFPAKDKGTDSKAQPGRSRQLLKHLLAFHRRVSILMSVYLVSQPVTGAHELIIVIRDYSILVQQQTC